MLEEVKFWFIVTNCTLLILFGGLFVIVNGSALWRRRKARKAEPSLSFLCARCLRVHRREQACDPQDVLKVQQSRRGRP